MQIPHSNRPVINVTNPQIAILVSEVINRQHCSTIQDVCPNTKRIAIAKGYDKRSLMEEQFVKPHHLKPIAPCYRILPLWVLIQDPLARDI
ncbi:hypothetical protein CEXT_662711 [Caerostris extrusa]|uniref:Uncharacterized protein n=1 Tax=Caerostris extrusa TaxID=172846 RepID=A0AAV4UKC0_CAEEX|nr:hypothetical protein CEXT_662711 [Caerostris extrusa]